MGSAEPGQGFEEMYIAHYPAVHDYVQRRTTSSDDAADAIAETFIIAWRKFRAVPSGAEARYWLYGVARRVLANQRRGEARSSALAARLRAEFAENSGPIETADRDEIRTAFESLSGDDREILSLAGWEGLKATEIAVVLGCTHGTARIRLHRARKRLAKELQARGIDLARYGERASALMGARA